MNPKMQNSYDVAADGYVLAVKEKRWRDVKVWKREMLQMDKEAASEGEW